MTATEKKTSSATGVATIMVAEDDVALRELLILVLETGGFNAIPVAKVVDGLMILRTIHVDLILLDLRLGHDNGLDILKAARRVPSREHIPIILLTACADLNTVRAIAKMGVQGYFLKHQLSRTELIQRIHRQLGLKTMLGTDSVSGNKVTSEESMPKPRGNASDENGMGIELATGGKSDPLNDRLKGEAGSAADLLRSIKPIITREQVLEEADKCAELKAFSPTVAQLLDMTGESNYSLDEIARVIKRDQAIALKVLKMANSVVYSRGSAVDTVHQALSRIGVSQVRQLIQNIAVIDNFQRIELGEDFKSEWFWEHSIATGLIAAFITRSRDGDERAIDSAFTMGLLHDVARMVFVEQSGEMYKQVLKASAQLQLPLEQVETRMLLINHADLMHRVLNGWKFPKALAEPIAMHHLSLENAIKISPNGVNEISILALANRLAHVMLLGSSGNRFLYSCEKFAKHLEVSPDTIRAIQQTIPEQAADMKLAMLQTCGASSVSYRDAAIKLFGGNVKAIYISANSAIDGYGIFFEQLGNSDRKSAPNICVMYLTEAGELDSLLKTLKRREEELQIQSLPSVLLVAPTVKVDQRAMVGRIYIEMIVPASIQQIAEAFNGLAVVARA